MKNRSAGSSMELGLDKSLPPGPVVRAMSLWYAAQGDIKTRCSHDKMEALGRRMGLAVRFVGLDSHYPGCVGGKTVVVNTANDDDAQGAWFVAAVFQSLLSGLPDADRWADWCASLATWATDSVAVA